MSSVDGQYHGVASELGLLVQLLRESWPVPCSVTPATLGIGTGPGARRAFLDAVLYMSDHGLLSYEALVVCNGDPRIIEATLTARGRIMLNNPMSGAMGAGVGAGSVTPPPAAAC